MSAPRVVLLACVVLMAVVAAAPAAEATSCATAPPTCPPGAVPYPKRSSPLGCSGPGITWTCAWLW